MNRLFDSPPAAFTVGELARQIKRAVESSPVLSDISVEGEISNFTAHSSGHLYFTLKDDKAQIRSCMWKSQVRGLPFRPANGDRVVATGSVDFYEARGEVSIVSRTLRFAGQGALWEALERIRTRLAEEGLFDASRKRPLPRMPRVVGLITSPTGAVAHDVLSVLRRRWPMARMVFIAAKVQGYDAAPDLIRALSWAATLDDLDVLIIGRGGGSAEDLWAFNDEALARAAAAFPRPLISAVGHETDFTILDFAADLRAPTPSAAAELAVPDLRDLQTNVSKMRQRMVATVTDDIAGWRRTLDALRNRRVLTHPADRLQALRQQAFGLANRAQGAMERRVKIERRLLEGRVAQLSALDPRLVLQRGYALIEKAEDGSVITSAAGGHAGDDWRIVFADGAVKARVLP